MNTVDRTRQRLMQILDKGYRLFGLRHFSEDKFSSWVESDDFFGWKASAESFLHAVFGPEHAYSRMFIDKCYDNSWERYLIGVSVLEAAKEEIESGFLTKVVNLVTSEVFVNFIEMAEYYLSLGHKDSAALLGGAVLEDGLKKIAHNSGIELKSSFDLSAVNQLLVQKTVYNDFTRKRIQALEAIRNAAAHGQFDKYTSEDVRHFLDEISSVFDTYLIQN